MVRFHLKIVSLVALLVGIISNTCTANAATLADSSKDFSTTQSQNGWYYGYYDINGQFQELQNNPKLPPGNNAQVIANDWWSTSWGEMDSNTVYLNGTGSPDWLVRRWVSDFDGAVNISSQLKTPNPSDLMTQILIDGVNPISQFGSSSANSGSRGIYDFNIDVQVGSVVDFLIAPNDNLWNGAFQFSARIDVLPGLVFLQSDDPASSHVGLFAGNNAGNNNVYEANKAYATGTYQDKLNNDDRYISQSQSGVQKFHSLGSFVHQSQTDDSPITEASHVELSNDIALEIAQQIETQLGLGGYLDPDASNLFLTPEWQKGAFGSFTDVGLIEWAAESVGLNSGQGFIPNHLEFILVGGILPELIIPYRFHNSEGPPGQASNDTSFHLLIDNEIDIAPSYEEIDDRLDLFTHEYDDIPLFGVCVIGVPSPCNGSSTSKSASTLTPEWLHYWTTAGFDLYSKDWLQGGFEAVDFVLTDPLDRRLGYTKELGLLNDIPGAFYTGDAPIEHFFIPDRLPGEYKVEIFGDCKAGERATLGDNHGETLVPTCTILAQTTPESSTTPGLLILGSLGTVLIWNKKKRQKRSL